MVNKIDVESQFTIRERVAFCLLALKIDHALRGWIGEPITVKFKRTDNLVSRTTKRVVDRIIAMYGGPGGGWKISTRNDCGTYYLEFL